MYIISVLQRFNKKVEKIPGGCWIWKGAKVNGYGVIVIDYKRHTTHRLAYLLHTGKNPPNILHHTCDRRDCVNPKHLEGYKSNSEHLHRHSDKVKEEVDFVIDDVKELENLIVAL